MNRQCGECGQCCRTFAIPELGLKDGQACGYLGRVESPTGRCDNYGERPEVCQNFRCLWLDGWEELRAHHRPDHMRAIFTWALPPAALEKRGIAGIIPPVLRASSAPSGPTEGGRLLIARLAGTYCVAEVRQGFAELHGPSRLRQAVIGLLAEVGAVGLGLKGVQELCFNGGRIRWRVEA